MTKDDQIERLTEKVEFLARTNMLYSEFEHRDAAVTSQLIRKGIEATKIKAEDEALMQIALEALESFIPFLRLDDIAQMHLYDQAVRGLTQRLKGESK